MLTFASLGGKQRGRLAQLVEHLVYTERVVGSSPTASTMMQSRSELLKTQTS